MAYPRLVSRNEESSSLSSDRAWPLDYGWATRGAWDPSCDVLLEGRVTPILDLNAALAELFAKLSAGSARIDAKEVAGHYAGGVFVHLDLQALASRCRSVWMHASGEDAFDSLHSVSQRICETLKHAAPRACVTWHEHPHDRISQRREVHQLGRS